MPIKRANSNFPVQQLFYKTPVHIDDKTKTDNKRIAQKLDEIKSK